ncbi:MAG TPA: hypothetical protein VGP31_09665 [Planosporangium sp.]|nr:hypothetical protein [Planosporangium sp.]
MALLIAAWSSPATGAGLVGDGGAGGFGCAGGVDGFGCAGGVDGFGCGAAADGFRSDADGAGVCFGGEAGAFPVDDSELGAGLPRGWLRETWMLSGARCMSPVSVVFSVVAAAGGTAVEALVQEATPIAASAMVSATAPLNGRISVLLA